MTPDAGDIAMFTFFVAAFVCACLFDGRIRRRNYRHARRRDRLRTARRLREEAEAARDDAIVEAFYAEPAADVPDLREERRARVARSEGGSA